MQLVKKRSDMTEVRGIRRADPVRAWELSATEAGREMMLRKFDEDVHTGPGHVVRNSQLATWEKIHYRWNPEEPVLPLTWHKIRAVAAHMKSAGYRSWSNYASRIKEEHVLAGHPWTLLLETCFRKAKRSVLRGIGPVVQALPLGIKDVMLVDELDLLVSADMPINLKDMYVVASFFMLREIETSALMWRHVQLDLEAHTISFMLSISKTDVTAAGCRRCWVCVCVVGPRVVPCPFHSFLAHRNDLLQRGETWTRPDAPVFPDARGGHVSKAAFVAGLRVLGAAVGARPSKGQGEIGGHSPRVEGAQYLASLGIDLAIIQLMARHSSSTSMCYVRDSPLIAITGLTRAKAAAKAEQDASVIQSWQDGQVRRQLRQLKKQVALLSKVQTHMKGIQINDDLLEHGDAITNTASSIHDLTAIINLDTMKPHIVKVGQEHTGVKAAWRTRCPWWYSEGAFKFMSAEEVLKTPSLRSNLCRRCWRGIDCDLESSASE